MGFAINDTFKMRLSAEKVLTYKLAICRDYALFTASLLLNLYPEVYFATFYPHVATGVKIKDKIYMLDQKLPICTLDKWLEVWNKKKVTLYKLEKVHTDNSIELRFSKVERYPQNGIRDNNKNNDDNYGECFQKLEQEINRMFGLDRTQETINFAEIKPKKNFIRYWENDEIVEYSILRLLKNNIEAELCSNVNRMTKIKLIRQDNDPKLVIYLR